MLVKSTQVYHKADRIDFDIKVLDLCFSLKVSFFYFSELLIFWAKGVVITHSSWEVVHKQSTEGMS